MKRAIFGGGIFLFIAVLVGVWFVFSGDGNLSSETENAPTVTYRCDAGAEIRAQFSDTSVSFELSDGRSFTLQKTPFENEDAFSNRDGSVVLWVRDYGAFLEENEESTYTGCVVYPLTFPNN